MSNSILRPNGTMQLRGGTAEAMATENPLLARREVAAEVDTGKLKVGNGVDRWNALPYVGGSGSGDHEELEGLLGGAVAGHYHITQEQNRRLAILINALFPNDTDEIYIPYIDDSNPENPILLPYTPFQNLPKGTPPDWEQYDIPEGYKTSEGIHKMYYGNYYYQTTSSLNTGVNVYNALIYLLWDGSQKHTFGATSLLQNTQLNGTEINYIYGPTENTGRYYAFLYDKFNGVLYYSNGEGVKCTKNNTSTLQESGFVVVNSNVLDDCCAICYSEDLDKMLAVGTSGKAVVMKSSSAYYSSNTRYIGTTAKEIGMPVNMGGAAWSLDEKVFCVCGAQGTATSSDGENWLTHTGTATPKNLMELSYREDLRCFFARNATNKLFYASGDGETWQVVNRTPIPLETVEAVDYSPATGIYCAVGGTGREVYFSKDLDTWVPTNITNGDDVEAGSVLYVPSAKRYVLMPKKSTHFYTFDPSEWITHSAATYNEVYLNEDLGEFSNEISATIRAGTFTDINPGKYFDFSNVAYEYLDENNTMQSDTYTGRIRVMHLDYLNIATHHIAVVPDGCMFEAVMNDTDTTIGGYALCKYREVYRRRAEAIFRACFGADHVLSYTENLINAVTGNEPSGTGEYNCTVELMDERMVWNNFIFGSDFKSEGAIYSHTQFAAFKLNYALRKANTTEDVANPYWLRNVSSSSNFCGVGTGGYALSRGASRSYGVRPFAFIN